MLQKSEIDGPRFVTANDESSFLEAVEHIRFPCFLKLTKGAGSVGTRRIGSRAEYQQAYADLVDQLTQKVPINITSGILRGVSKSKPRIIIEDYLAPDPKLEADGLGRVTIELLTQKGEILFIAIGDGECVSSEDHRYRSLAFPSALPKKHVAAFHDLSQRIVEAFGLLNGPIVIDAVMTKDGPYVFEVNARIDSAIVLPTLTHACEFDMVLGAVEVALGLPISAREHADVENGMNSASVEIGFCRKLS